MKGDNREYPTCSTGAMLAGLCLAMIVSMIMAWIVYPTSGFAKRMDAIFARLFQWVKDNRLWLIIPAVILLLLLAALIAFASAAHLGPLIYPLL